MNILRNMFLSLVILSIWGCGNEMSTLEYPLSSFYKLTVKNDISIRFIQDSANFIRISGPSEVVENIELLAKGDTLVLSNPTILGNYYGKVWAEVHFTDFKALLLRNGGDVINDDTLRFTSFSIGSNKAMGDVNLCLVSRSLSLGISTGSLLLEISGQVKNLHVWTTAEGRIDTRDLQAETVICTNNSSNDSYVSASKSLTARTEYLGRIFYYGNPASITIESGQEDKVIHLEE